MPFDGTNFSGNEALAKVDAVIDLLADEQRWCKGSLRNAGGQMCLMGALQWAHAEAILKPIVLLSAQEVTGRRFRTIETFNDNGSTTHAVILQVLHRTRENIATGRWLNTTQKQSSQARGWSLLQRVCMQIRAMT